MATYKPSNSLEILGIEAILEYRTRPGHARRDGSTGRVSTVARARLDRRPRGVDHGAGRHGRSPPTPLPPASSTAMTQRGGRLSLTPRPREPLESNRLAAWRACSTAVCLTCGRWSGTTSTTESGYGWA